MDIKKEKKKKAGGGRRNNATHSCLLCYLWVYTPPPTLDAKRLHTRGHQTLVAMTSELTSPCSCALDFTAHTHTHKLSHTAFGERKEKKKKKKLNVCSCRFIQYHPKFSRGLFLTPLLSHSGDRGGEMLLTVSVCS